MLSELTASTSNEVIARKTLICSDMTFQNINISGMNGSLVIYCIMIQLP